MPKAKKSESVEKTEKGAEKLEAPKETKSFKNGFSVKEIRKGVFAVFNSQDEKLREYMEEEGCANPQEAAESYAYKMSLRS